MTAPKLPEPATGAMKVVAWWVEAIGLGQREKPHPSCNPEPLVRLSDAQALAGEVERLRAVLGRAAEMCEWYAEVIRTHVISVDIERHPYLPELEDVAQQAREASGSMGNTKCNQSGG